MSIFDNECFVCVFVGLTMNILREERIVAVIIIGFNESFVEETVKAIQSRASIYMSEQYQ